MGGKLRLKTTNGFKTMFADLGTYLVEKGEIEPFEIAVFNGLSLEDDPILGWIISGVTYQFRVKETESESSLPISEPMMFSIYLGRGSETRARKIVEQLRTKGLVVITREDKKYLLPSGKQWVVPLEYLKNKSDQ